MRYLTAILFSSILFYGCNFSASDKSEQYLCVTVLAEKSATADGGEEVDYQLLRLTCKDKAPSYALWIPPSEPSSAAILIAVPYKCIDWTGEDVDIEYALTATTVDTDELATESSTYFRKHEMGVLYVFGRFYAEGNIQNDVDDMTAGLKFFERENLVDNHRIAIYGSSWGGFEALYGAAHAPIDAVPVAGVAIYPLSNFEDWANYVNNFPNLISDQDKVNEWTDFSLPYQDRVFNTTGGAPGSQGADYSDWNTQGLIAKLETPFLVIHEMWDTLVPFSMSEKLVNESNGNVEPVWFLHEDPLDYNTHDLSHGEISDVYYTFAFVYILKKITLPSQNITALYNPDDFHGFMQYIHKFQDDGYDMEWIVPRLLELTDDRIIMYNTLTGNMSTGKALIVQEINTVWGLNINEDDIVGLFAEGNLPD